MKERFIHIRELTGYFSFLWLKSCCICPGIPSLHEPAACPPSSWSLPAPMGRLFGVFCWRGLLLRTFSKTFFIGSLNWTYKQLHTVVSWTVHIYTTVLLCLNRYGMQALCNNFFSNHFLYLRMCYWCNFCRSILSMQLILIIKSTPRDNWEFFIISLLWIKCNHSTILITTNISQLLTQHNTFEKSNQ